MEAAGLASSIITFLDLAFKVVARTREYMQEHANAPEFLRTIESQVPLLAKSLDILKQHALGQKLSGEPAKELFRVIEDAFIQLKHLDTYVRMLKPSGPSPLRKFDRAFKSVFKYDTKIHDALEKLKDLTDTLVFYQVSISLGHTDKIMYAKSVHDEQVTAAAERQQQEIIKTWIDGASRDNYIDNCISKRAPETCTYIFNTPAYKAWYPIDKTTTKVMWINGPPGFGKTFLSASIFTHLETTGDLAAAVFWTSEGQFSSSPLDAIPRSWLIQLLSQKSELFDYIKATWSSSKSGRATSKEIWTCLEQVLANSPQSVILTLDGLDEYQQQKRRRLESVGLNHANELGYIDIQEFLQTLKVTVENFPCRLLIVSQRDPEIQVEIMSPPLKGHNVEIYEHCLSVDDIKDDLRAFAAFVIEAKLPKKAQSLKDDLTDMMTSKAEGQMLWIALQQRGSDTYLRPSYSERKLKSMIDNIPIGIENLYKANLDRILGLDAYDRQRALRILHWILYSLRPLSVHELVEAILIDPDDENSDENCSLELDFPEDDLPTDPNEEDVFGEIRSLCGNFVQIEVDQQQVNECGKWKVRLAHSSIRLFLQAMMPSHVYGILESDTSTVGDRSIVGELCLRYLRYGGIWPVPDKISSISITLSAHPLLAYAATYWPMYITEKTRKSMSRGVLIFLNHHFDKFLQWAHVSRQVQNPSKAGLADLYSDISPWQSWRYDSRLAFAVGLRYQEIVKFFCKSGECVDPVESNPLHVACEIGDVSMIRLLLDSGADINRQADDGEAPIICAVRYGSVNAVEELISRSADLNKADSSGWTALHQTALKGHAKIAQILLDAGANPLAVNHAHATPLLIACFYGQVEVASVLLQTDELVTRTISIADKKGIAPLAAAVESEHLATIKLLLSKGADVLQPKMDWLTAVHCAASVGILEIFDALYSHVKDTSTFVRSTTKLNGWTVLHYAGNGKNVEIVKTLLNDGADVLQKDAFNLSPLQHAMSGGSKDVVELMMERVDKTNFELGHDAGFEWLRSAIKSDLDDMVTFLLNRGADVQRLIPTPYGGRTLLNFACRFGRTKVVKILLDTPGGRNLLERSADDTGTPLLIACAAGKDETMELLLDEGANHLAVDADGFSALGLAAASGSMKCVKILLDRFGPVPFGAGVLHGAAISGKKDVFDHLRRTYDIPGAEVHGKLGLTLLHCAATGHNIEIMKEVLSQTPGDMISRKSLDGRSSLFFACREGDHAAVALLLERLKACRSPSPFERDDILAAAAQGNVEVVKLLYESDPARFKAVHKDSTSPLHVAIANDRVDMTEYLIRQGYKMTEKDHDGLTCFHATACAKSAKHGLSRIAIPERVNSMLTRTNSGLTPLLEASRHGRTAMTFRWLVSDGADLNDTVEFHPEYSNFLMQGWSATHFAARSGLLMLSPDLAEQGKEALERQTHLGLRTIHLASNAILSDFVLEHLIQQGVETKVRNAHGETPLFFAVHESSQSAVDFLLREGTGSFERSKQSYPSVVDLAVCHSNAAIIRSLYKDGFSLAPNSRDGLTLLHLAASFSADDVIDFLLKHDTSLKWDTLDDHGWTASDCKHVGKRSTKKNVLSKAWQRPAKWITNSNCNSDFQVHTDGLTVSLSGALPPKVSDQTGQESQDHPRFQQTQAARVVTLTADHYFLPTPNASYFEITIEECTASSIGIGLDRFIGEHNRLLGLMYFSYAYYGDDGKISRTMPGAVVGEFTMRYGPTFTQGDVVGCGIDYDTKQVFYTKNGICLGVAADSVNGRFAPAFTTYQGTVRVRGNFGQSPFRFDVSKHGYGNRSCEQCYSRLAPTEDWSRLYAWLPDRIQDID